MRLIQAPTSPTVEPRSGAPLRLLISCPDQPGIVSRRVRFVYEAGGNILRSDQYTTDPAGGTFFLRMEFTLAAERS